MQELKSMIMAFIVLTSGISFIGGFAAGILMERRRTSRNTRGLTTREADDGGTHSKRPPLGLY